MTKSYKVPNPKVKIKCPMCGAVQYRAMRSKKVAVLYLYCKRCNPDKFADIEEFKV